MTNPITGWFQLTRAYNDDTGMTIVVLDIMYLTRYPGKKECIQLHIYTS